MLFWALTISYASTGFAEFLSSCNLDFRLSPIPMSLTREEKVRKARFERSNLYIFVEDFSGQTKIKLFLCAGLRYLFFAAVTEPLQNHDCCWVFAFLSFFFWKVARLPRRKNEKKLVRWGREIKRALQTHNLKSASITHYAFASVTVGCFTDTRSVLDCRRFNNGKLGLINNRCSSERRKLSLTETLIHCKPYGAFLCNKPP